MRILEEYWEVCSRVESKGNNIVTELFHGVGLILRRVLDISLWDTP